MGAKYRELGPLGRDLAIWEIHLRSIGKSTHTIKSYVQGVRALAAWLTEEGLPLDPEAITTNQLRAFQAHLLLSEDQGGAAKLDTRVGRSRLRNHPAAEANDQHQHHCEPASQPTDAPHATVQIDLIKPLARWWVGSRTPPLSRRSDIGMLLVVDESLRAQLGDRLEGQRPDGALGAAHHRGRIAHRQVGEVPQDDRSPLPRREGGDGIAHRDSVGRSTDPPCVAPRRARARRSAARRRNRRPRRIQRHAMGIGARTRCRADFAPAHPHPRQRT